jgi:cAMP-dependent protein kinase regulator
MSFKLPDRDRDARVLQSYVQERVNPILEGMVTQILLEKPENVLQFMIKHLRQSASGKAEEGPMDEESELDEMRTKVDRLRQQAEALEARLSEAA